MEDSQPTRWPKILNQSNSSTVNLYELSSRKIVKGMDIYEATSADLHLPPEVGIHQVGESDKIINYSSFYTLLN